jgi:transglutaminase/protease-like cytokinesis protein 3
MRKIFTFLFAALMSAASMWAQTETLLTTITATAKEQASYSTANVATVSFSYTAYGSSAYFANWGWWGYGWSATVNAAEGYTITKCVFYDDANRTATDSEAPFVVETTEEDKTPKVNGTPIMADMSKGIKKIDVYGYENPTTVAVTGVKLNQNEAQMTVGGETLTLTATVNPNNATDKSVSWSTSDANVATVENGVVTAVAAGNATITVTTTDGFFTATCAVTVTAPEPAAEVTVVFAANSNTKEVSVELPHTFWCDLGTENGELDLIIQELYALPLGGYCDAWNGPVATGNPAVTAGADLEDNDFITISEAFEGTATVSGKYNKYTEMDEEEFYYTLTISTKNGVATAISNTAVDTKAVKRIVNGQLLIVRDGKLFNLQGAQVR